jgi:hypothetical protein
MIEGSGSRRPKNIRIRRIRIQIRIRNTALTTFSFWLFSGCLYFLVLYCSVEHVGALDRDPHGLRSGRGDGQLRDQALARHRGQSLRGTVSFIIIIEGFEGIPYFSLGFFFGLASSFTQQKQNSLSKVIEWCSRSCPLSCYESGLQRPLSSNFSTNFTSCWSYKNLYFFYYR